MYFKHQPLFDSLGRGLLLATCLCNDTSAWFNLAVKPHTPVRSVKQGCLVVSSIRSRRASVEQHTLFCTWARWLILTHRPACLDLQGVLHLELTAATSRAGVVTSQSAFSDLHTLAAVALASGHTLKPAAQRPAVLAPHRSSPAARTPTTSLPPLQQQPPSAAKKQTSLTPVAQQAQHPASAQPSHSIPVGSTSMPASLKPAGAPTATASPPMATHLFFSQQASSHAGLSAVASSVHKGVAPSALRLAASEVSRQLKNSNNVPKTASAASAMPRGTPSVGQPRSLSKEALSSSGVVCSTSSANCAAAPHCVIPSLPQSGRAVEVLPLVRSGAARALSIATRSEAGVRHLHNPLPSTSQAGHVSQQQV